MTQPYYQDDTVTLYLGRFEEHLDVIGDVDLVVADPPYGETSLAWDRWPTGWPALIAGVTRSMWCFGSMRMFLDQRDEFTGWRQSQDVVWEKHNGTGFAADRFKRVHEFALHWYRGAWGKIYRDTPRVPATFDAKGRTTSESRRSRTSHTGVIGRYSYVDDGMRLARSVLRVPSVRRGIHLTEKPVNLLTPLIEYGCPPGGVVLDPFAGSASTLDAARQSGRRAVGVEFHEPYAEAAALRLSQEVLA